jgi:hypothetical protein
MKAVALLFTLMLSSVGYGAPSCTSVGSGNSHGELTVTATVVASIALIIGPNGEQKYIVANAPDLERELSIMMAANAHPKAALKDPSPRASVSRVAQATVSIFHSRK